MRHNVYGKKLSRNKDERDVLFKSLVHNLFSHGTIETSEAKSKAVKGLVDKIINLAKDKTSKRLVQSYFNKKELEERLIKELLPKFENRISGYTSITKLGRRLGDNTMIVKMSLIGAEQLKPVEKVTSDKRPASQAKRGEQVTSKKTKEVKTQKLKVKSTSKNSKVKKVKEKTSP